MLCAVDRLRGRVAAAQRRLAGRVRRPARHPRVSREPRRGASQRLPDSGVGARHQSGVGADGRACRSSSSPATTTATSISPISRPRRARTARRSRRDHDHLSVDARRVRGRHPPDLRDRPCARRPGLRRRREHERAGRPRRAGRVRRRRLAPEPAQDLLHSARRRRPGRRSDRRRRAPRAVPARASLFAAARGDARIGAVVGRALRHRVDPADLVDVHRDDGRARASPRRPRARSSPPTTSRSASRRITRCSTRARAASSRTNASSICGRSRRRATSPSTTSPSA